MQSTVGKHQAVLLKTASPDTSLNHKMLFAALHDIPGSI